MNFKKKIFLLTLEEDLLKKSIYKNDLEGFLPKNCLILSIVNIFFLKFFLKKEMFRIRNTHFVFNFFPFQRFKLIYNINIVLKKFIIFLFFLYAFFQKKSLVLFTDFDFFLEVKKMDSLVYLLLPDLNKLSKSKQIELIEIIRVIAILSKKVFVKTIEEKKEMKVFNENVFIKNW